MNIRRPLLSAVLLIVNMLLLTANLSLIGTPPDKPTAFQISNANHENSGDTNTSPNYDIINSIIRDDGATSTTTASIGDISVTAIKYEEHSLPILANITYKPGGGLFKGYSPINTATNTNLNTGAAVHRSCLI